MSEPNSIVMAAEFLRSARDTIVGIPSLLEEQYPVEAATITKLLATVDGTRTDGIPQCAFLWRSGEAFLASAVFLGGRWLITAEHAVRDPGDYNVTLPVKYTSDFRSKNSFRVAKIVREPSGADLALLSVSSIAQSPKVPRPDLATEQEVRQSSTAQVCGVGSDDCQNLSCAGVKRISAQLNIVPDSTVTSLGADPATDLILDNGGPRRVLCLSDSGGAALIAMGGHQKVAGIIRETLPGYRFSQCTRLGPFMTWIRQTTALPF